TPAAANLHHAWAPRQGADVEVVHDQVAGKPDLVAVNLRAAVVVEQLSDGGVIVLEDPEASYRFDLFLGGHFTSTLQLRAHYCPGSAHRSPAAGGRRPPG